MIEIVSPDYTKKNRDLFPILLLLAKQQAGSYYTLHVAIIIPLKKE